VHQVKKKRKKGDVRKEKKKKSWVDFWVPQVLQGEKGDDLRSNHFEERENDENHYTPLKDPLHVPVGSITRARSKKIQESLN